MNETLETSITISFLILSILAYLALGRVFSASRRRLLSARDQLVIVGLEREEQEQLLEIAQRSFCKRILAVRNVEKQIFGQIPDAEHQEKLKAIVTSQQARQNIDGFLQYSAAIEQKAKDEQKDLTRQLSEKRERIQVLNRRFRLVDQALIIATAIIRFCLIATVIYTIINLAFGPLA
ncbi:hypothetical protein [Nocardiopsis sp. NPDC006938]|uniref:hypothetical protein n=1 Tax=Nocardiopsis sp. NPDC006938 TaxID=3364337 RepID=UPI0036A31094